MSEFYPKQYNEMADNYSDMFSEMNKKSIEEFNGFLSPFDLSNKKIVDLGCGEGHLISYLKEKGANCSGVDASDEMVEIAKNRTSADVRVESFSKTSFEDNEFDFVVSKWAIQTIDEIEPVYSEALRILKPGGYFIFLAVHPFRHFLEKKKQGKDYFKKEIVESIIFKGTITVKEPSHTMTDYLSEFFLKNFELEKFFESHEFPGAEQINGDTYPTHFIIKARKK